MEKIQYAAIKWQFKHHTGPGVTYTTGYSHSQCREVLFASDVSFKDINMDQFEEGFLTDKNRFVSRQEAFTIAKGAGQLTPCYKDLLNTHLMSYMIDWRR